MVTIAERLSCAYDRVIKAEQTSPFSDEVKLLAVSKTCLLYTSDAADE